MLVRNAGVAVLLGVAALTSLPVRAQASSSTASCSQAIDDLDRQTASFVGDVETENLNFIRTDIRDTALAGIKKHFAGNPTSDAAFDLREKYEQWDEWRQSVLEFRTMMEELQVCLNTKGCLLTRFAEQQHQATAKWIQSLDNEGINAATERVNKAASLVQGYASKALNMATGSALSVVDACKTEFEQRAESTSQNREPDLGRTPAAGGSTPPAAGGPTPVAASVPAVVPPPDGRGGAGKWILAAGAIGGGLYGVKYLQDNYQGGTCGNEPSINFDACYYGSASGATCQSALRELEAYCASCNMRRGREANATSCVQ